MQKESTRTDQTRARNSYGTCPILTGQGIHLAMSSSFLVACEQRRPAALASTGAPQSDYFIVLSSEPLVRYVSRRFADLGITVSREGQAADSSTQGGDMRLLLGASRSALEAEAEYVGLPKRLRPLGAGEPPRCASETDWPFRDFCSAQRADFLGVDGSDFFCASERAVLVGLLVNSVPPTEDIAAALAAAGIDHHPSPHQRSLCHFLDTIGALKESGPLHTSGRRDAWDRSLQALGVSYRSLQPLLLHRPLVDVDAVRTYWGERTAFYFAWQSFYVRALSVPAALGLLTWWLRPRGMSIEDDVHASLFSLCAVVWAIFFVQGWRRRQGELSFTWVGSDADHAEPVRSEFAG
eukprot:4515772-Prymnesium_polylepis.1